VTHQTEIIFESCYLAYRYDDELGEFRRWCQVADKAVKLSGVSADEVEEKVEAHRRLVARLLIILIAHVLIE